MKYSLWIVTNQCIDHSFTEMFQYRFLFHNLCTNYCTNLCKSDANSSQCLINLSKHKYSTCIFDRWQPLSICTIRCITTLAHPNAAHEQIQFHLSTTLQKNDDEDEEDYDKEN